MKNNYGAQLKSIVLSKNLPTPFTSPPTFFAISLRRGGGEARRRRAGMETGNK